MQAKEWSAVDIPDQSDRVAIVTGASSGIGLETARALAAKNASVILAVRDAGKGQRALESILAEYPAANVTVRLLDLADLACVKRFAEEFHTAYKQLDLLINNAGVMMCPYAKTVDGFEMQFGTNHLGHFALTGHLLPSLTATDNARIVVVSSLAHRRGRLDFDDINWEDRKYDTGQAYCDSKLANLYFTYALAAKLQSSGNSPLITAAHPGWTQTDLQRHARLFRWMGCLMAQDSAAGALPTLRAAVDAGSQPGDFYGPCGRRELKGAPIKVQPAECAKDIDAAEKLWALSEQMTGVHY